MSIQNFCCGLGNIKFKVYFEKNSYSFGETALLATDVDLSNFSGGVSSVDVKLYNSLMVYGKHSEKEKLTTIKEMDLGSIPKGESWIGDKRKFT